VTVGNSGFTLAGSGGVMPPIPKLPAGDYDYVALTTKLTEVKNQFKDETKATFNADAGTAYEIVIKTLDAMREDKDGHMLFPDIVFCSGDLVMGAQAGVSPEVEARLKGKKAIRSYARKLADPEEITSLNITPMMDMMTIILVFLLKSFTSSAMLVNQDQNMLLPTSNSRLNAKQAIAVTVTKRVLAGRRRAGGAHQQWQVRSGPQARPAPTATTFNAFGRHPEPGRAQGKESGRDDRAEVRRRAHHHRGSAHALPSPHRSPLLCGQAEYANYRLLILKSRE